LDISATEDAFYFKEDFKNIKKELNELELIWDREGTEYYICLEIRSKQK
jgi:hypothetical protein